MIRVPNIRVIDQDGKQLGIMSTRDAITMATNSGFDLIEISPTANPPVCRIGDFGKYKYELAKKQKDAKKKQHIVHLKELKMHPKTEEYDYGYRIKHAKEFLLDGDKVKITVAFKGREMAYLEFGRNMLNKANADLADIADCELNARMEGKNMFSVFSVKKDVFRKAKAEKEKLKKLEEEKKKSEGPAGKDEESSKPAETGSTNEAAETVQEGA
jgi:translation initiation factor IF-3